MRSLLDTENRGFWMMPPTPPPGWTHCIGAAIRSRLAGKGIPAEVAAEAISGLRKNAPDPDIAAACAFARRRRLGPFRRAAADRQRELAVFARAGFSRRVAEAVLACSDVEAVEALARGGLC